MIKIPLDYLKKQLAQLDNLHYHYASIQIPLPEKILLSPVSSCDSFFLSRPESAFTLVGLDSLITIKALGKQRFTTIKEEYSSCLKSWHYNKSNPPMAFLAFAFDEQDTMQDCWQSLPNCLLTIPRILFQDKDSLQVMTVNIDLAGSYSSQISKIEQLLESYFSPVLPDTKQHKTKQEARLITSAQKDAYQHWHSLAQNAIRQIKSKKFDKLVTSRYNSISTSEPVSVSHLVYKLAHYYPSCSILSYSSSGKTIVAASPEQLLSLQHPDIQSNAIGGTISRTTQPDKNNSLPFFLKQNTQQNSDELSESKKLLKEHHFISQAIYENLDPLCYSLKMPVAPFLMKLHNLYHLETPVQGKLMDKYDLFDCITALHPTPAVAGLPRQQAKQWLINNEDYQRGWYTGAFGWIDADMNGDLSVLLRCALIENTPDKKQEIHLFAGAGLVAESDPDAEWQETELKMQTIMEILG